MRRDKGDPNYWVPMQRELVKSLSVWDSSSVSILSNDTQDVNSFVNIFNNHINSALFKSLKVRPKFSDGNRKQNINFDPTVFRLTCEENKAFKQFYHADLPVKNDFRLHWKKCKSRLKNAIRNIGRLKLRECVQKLESLRPRDIRGMWDGLHELDNTSVDESKIPLLVKNSSNILVGGSDASQVWMESFSRLGLENTDFNDYDNDFYAQVKESIKDFEVQSFENKFELDNPITLEEVKLAVRKLKKGKAVGVDGLFNEIFKYGGDEVTKCLWKFYQGIFKNEQFPTDWSRGMIFPLFKGGPEEGRVDPNKYRGITLLSIVGKTYTSILNNRLSDYVENNGILVDEQAGFRKNRSTVDQLFILTEVIKYRRPNKTYCAFIDVAKAYDKVWRNGLWYKLWKYGIRGKMWRVLRNIYKKVESCVLLGDSRTDFFEIEVGLRQGCILSPLLFNLFINDLRDHVHKLKKGVRLGRTRISLLYFADDIVILADSKEDLEIMLQAVYEFSLKWRLKFNYDKCNVVVFNNKKTESLKYGNCTGKCNCANHYAFGPHLIRAVLFYKYLGVELDNCLNFKIFKDRILGKAKINMGRIWSMGIRGGYLSVKGSINLWEALVRSTLEYGSEIWGSDLWPEGEQIQADMAKRILRCSTMTTREAMYGDLGWWPLQSRRHYKKCVYWYHLETLPDDRLLKKVYIITKDLGKKTTRWANVVKGVLGSYGMGYLCSNNQVVWNVDGKGNQEAKNVEDHKKFFKKYSRTMIHDYEERSWWNRMNEGDVTRKKIRNYVKFKKKLRLEKYLLVNSSSQGRRYHTSLRTGTNILEIEKGRYERVHRDFRFCKNCDLKAVESEEHFLLECPKYDRIRKEFFQIVCSKSGGKWDFASRGREEVFVLLLQGTGDEYEKMVFRLFHTYLERCFEVRVEVAE